VGRQACQKGTTSRVNADGGMEPEGERGGEDARWGTDMVKRSGSGSESGHEGEERR